MYETKKLKDCAIIIAGQSPESKYYNTNGEGIPYYNRFTVRGTAASRVFFRIVVKAVRMGGYWPDVRLQ